MRLCGKGSATGETRASALWGSGNRAGDSRSRSLRSLPLVAIALVAFAVPLSASGGKDGRRSYVAPAVLQAAGKGAKVNVIVQAAGVEQAKNALAGLGSLKQEFRATGMVSAEVPSAKVGKLAERAGLIVTLDAPVKATTYTSSQLWPHQNGLAKLWGGPAAPAIAIVDSGIDKSLPSFGSRVVQRQAFGQSGGALDGRGHGTFVAGIAAGEAAGYAGASPGSKLVDLDVIDDRGMARTSDVIAAAEWILKNKSAYNIRVANFSLHSSSVLSIRYHPLNRAVEKLWFGGVVVVAAAGNYGRADGPSGVIHAPGNDPFVITVGALDLGGSAKIGDDSVAPWSAYGYTNEGFMKPEVVAAGRYMVGPVPAGSTLAAEKAEKVVAPGYIQLSGTSFAAPVVAGIAAQMLARNPAWTPDMVKGALMKSARRLHEATVLQQGRGEVNAVRAATMNLAPVANAAINRFVVTDLLQGGRVFDAAAWHDAARTDAAWDSAAWTDAAWTDAAWTDAAWTDAAWTDAAWNDAAWNDAAWADSTSYEDAAEGDATSTDVRLTSEDSAEIATDPALQLPGTTVVTPATAPLGL
jgi:serine protease AprX